MLIITAIFSASGYWYVDQSTQEAKIQKARVTEILTKAQQQKDESAELQHQLLQARDKSLQAEVKFTQANERANQLKVQLELAQLKITESEKKVTETDKRAGWLLKLNRELKSQVKALTSEESTSEQQVGE